MLFPAGNRGAHCAWPKFWCLFPRDACSGACPSNSALVEITIIFKTTVLSLLLQYCHHPRKPQLCCCGAGDVNPRIYIFSAYFKKSFCHIYINAIAANTTGHVSSNALQHSKITSFSMDISLNRAGQRTPSGPAASSQGLLLGPDWECDTACPCGALPSETGWPCPACLLRMIPGFHCPPDHA